MTYPYFAQFKMAIAIWGDCLMCTPMSSPPCLFPGASRRQLTAVYTESCDDYMCTKPKGFTVAVWNYVINIFWLWWWVVYYMVLNKVQCFAWCWMWVWNFLCPPQISQDPVHTISVVNADTSTLCIFKCFLPLPPSTDSANKSRRI